MFKPNTYAKKCYFHATTAISQATTISNNALKNWNTHYNDNFDTVLTILIQTCDTVKLLSQRIDSLQKINKSNKKYSGGRPTF